MRMKIERLNDTGEGIGLIDNKVVFIPKVVLGDEVTVKNIINHKNYMVGDIDKVINYSKDRNDLVCPYYSSCGGCQLLNMLYEKQLEYKKNKVINMFKKYMNIDIDTQIIGTDYLNYRNKITLEVENGKLGLYKYRSHDVINIDECLLVSKKINNIIKLINTKVDLSLVKKVTIRESTSNDIMLLIEGIVKDISCLKKDVQTIYVNNKLVYGDGSIISKIGNYLYEISNDSFFQVNYNQMINLYDKIYEYVPRESKLLDLYCGTGSIGIYVSSKCINVLGIEINKNAIEDAKRNKEINKIDNIDFICGDVQDIISNDDSFDCVIVDPPRLGLSNKTKDILLNISSNSIIYVSCDPMTLVRDIKYLNSKYNIKSITLFDMFPNTYHCESVCILERKSL